jgi:hypothetical protein
MRLKTGWLALMASVAMTSAAAAECRIMSFIFHLSQNDSVSTTGVSTRGGACVTRLRSGSTSTFRSAAVTVPPAKGTLTEFGTMRFRYKPRTGANGTDRYSIRICGTDRAGTGCSTITHVITLE